MGKFRKKPVVIEAHRWFTYGDHPEVGLFRHPPVDPDTGEITVGSSAVYLGRMAHSDTPEKFRRDDCHALMHDHGFIDTLEGGHTVCPGDWIITGVAGEHYPCKPAIFDATYEPVDDDG